MRILIFILTLIFLTSLTSCDPFHKLILENRTSHKLDVIYYPSLDNGNLGNKSPDTILVNGKKMYKVILESAQTLCIGNVTARYTPNASDIHLDYLEINYGSDKIKLNGKNAIFSTIQKVDKLDWRLIVK